MLLRQSAVYFAANVSAALIGFLSVVVLTRFVAPAEYGVYVVAMTVGTVLATCFFTWQRHAILRFQSEQAADVRLSLLGGYLATLALYPLALLLLVTTFSVPLHKAIAAVLIAAALSFYELGQEILRARQRVAAYVRATLARSVISFLLCLLAVWCETGGMGLVAAVICGYLMSAAINAASVWEGPREPARREVIRQLAAYGLPITISGIFVALSLALDRFVIYTLLGTEAVGLYGATVDFVRQCAIVPALSASLAIAPLAVANLSSTDASATSRNLADGAELLIAVLLPAVVGLSVGAPQVAGTILGPEYRETAVGLMPIVAAAFFAHVVSQQYVQLSFGLARRPGQYIVHTGSILLVNAILMFPLVMRFGIYGAGLSLLVAEACGVLIGLVMARRAYPLPAIGTRLARIAGATLAMAMVVVAVQHIVGRQDLPGLIAIVAAGGLAYVGAAVALDVARLKRVFVRQLQRRAAVAVTVRADP